MEGFIDSHWRLECRRGALLWYLSILANSHWTAQSSEQGCKPTLVKQLLYRSNVVIQIPTELACTLRYSQNAYWVPNTHTLEKRLCVADAHRKEDERPDIALLQEQERTRPWASRTRSDLARLVTWVQWLAAILAQFKSVFFRMMRDFELLFFSSYMYFALWGFSVIATWCSNGVWYSCSCACVSVWKKVQA